MSAVLKTLGIESSESQWELAVKKRGFCPKWKARETLLPA